MPLHFPYGLVQLPLWGYALFTFAMVQVMFLAGRSKPIPGVRDMPRRRASAQPAAFILVIFEPSSDRSPSKPFSPKTKPMMGFPTMALSY